MKVKSNARLKKFKVRKNKVYEFIFSYEMKEGDIKYTIYTQDGGDSFTAIVEEKRLDNRYYQVKSKKFNTIDECLDYFDNPESLEK